MSDFFILNKFGITPSKNYTAAGYDFYIPNIIETEDTLDMCFDAFMASYKIKTREEIENIYNELSLQVSSKFDTEDSDYVHFNVVTSLNILHLYLAQNQQKTFTDADWAKVGDEAGIGVQFVRALSTWLVSEGYDAIVETAPVTLNKMQLKAFENATGYSFGLN